MKITKSYLKQIIKEELEKSNDAINHLDILDNCLEKMGSQPGDPLDEGLKKQANKSLEFLKQNVESLVVGEEGPEKQSKIIPALDTIRNIGIIINSAPEYNKQTILKLNTLINRLVAYFGIKY